MKVFIYILLTGLNRYKIRYFLKNVNNKIKRLVLARRETNARINKTAR